MLLGLAINWNRFCTKAVRAASPEVTIACFQRCGDFFTDRPVPEMVEVGGSNPPGPRKV